MYIRCDGTHTPKYTHYTANKPNVLLTLTQLLHGLAVSVNLSIHV